MIRNSYAFLSYKGGAGRTVTAANVAAVYAAVGYNVVCIDCDWDAPGMHNVFLAGSGSAQNAKGYVDATERLGVKYGIQDVLVGVDSHGTPVRPADYVSSSLCDFTPTVVADAALEWREARGLNALKRGVGTLKFLPGTTRLRGGLTRVPAKALKKRLDSVIVEIRKLRNPEVDFVFVDSLSGLNPVSELICDTCSEIVLCFRLGVQHREGAVIARTFFEASESLRDKRIWPVPSSVFGAEDIKGMGADNQDCVRKAQEASMRIVNAVFDTGSESPIPSVGYYPDLSVSERIVALDPHRPNDFERLAARLISAADRGTAASLKPLLTAATALEA